MSHEKKKLVQLDQNLSQVLDIANALLVYLVLPHCTRWRSLSLHVDPAYGHRVLDWLHPVNGRLHFLENWKSLTSTILSFLMCFQPLRTYVKSS